MYNILKQGSTESKIGNNQTRSWEYQQYLSTDPYSSHSTPSNLKQDPVTQPDNGI